MDRARSFTASLRDAIFEDLDAYRKAEGEAAEEFGLTVVAGNWRGLPGAGHDNGRAFQFTALYDGDTLVGLIDVITDRLFVYDDVQRRVTGDDRSASARSS